MKSKAQMEIMGLAIVIVLLTLAVLFTIQFVYLKPERDVKGSFESSQLAANTINAVLQTTSSRCYNHQVKKLISNCAVNPPIGTILCEPNTAGIRMSSCKKAIEEIDFILVNTLADWKLSYNFTIIIPGYVDTAEEFTFTPANFKCSGERESKIAPLQTDIGTINVRLDICS